MHRDTAVGSADIAARGGSARAVPPQVTLKGRATTLTAPLPEVGTKAPSFQLTDTDLSEVSSVDFRGQVKILNVVPSLDTTTCALSATRFNKEVQRMTNTVILNVSMDLPFASKRFCELGHIENIRTLSAFRAPNFGHSYGLRMTDGPLRGLLARAVVLIDQDDIVRYVELVPEIGQEPDYDAALAAVKRL